MYYTIPIGEEVFSYSPYLDTDANEFFQYIEVNFSPMGFYSMYINGKPTKQNKSFINRQEHHQNVQKIQGKQAWFNIDTVFKRYVSFQRVKD